MIKRNLLTVLTLSATTLAGCSTYDIGRGLADRVAEGVIEKPKEPIVLNPENTHFLRATANSYIERGRLREAEKLLKTINDKASLEKLTIIYFDNKDSKSGLRLLGNIIGQWEQPDLESTYQSMVQEGYEFKTLTLEHLPSYTNNAQ